MTFDFIFNGLVLLVDGAALHRLARSTPRSGWFAIVAITAVVFAISGVAFAANIFHAMRLYSFLLFLHVPILLGGASVLLFRRHRWLALMCASVVLGVVAIGINAFFIEPTALEVTRLRLETAKVSRPVRIGVLADFQTDRVGTYERTALRRLMQARPDVVLLPGDYIHIYSQKQWRDVAEALRVAMRDAAFHAPLGVFAVRGNVDPDGWTALFDGLPVTAMSQTKTLPVGEIHVTGLSLGDSFSRRVHVPAAAGFHVVFGHAPDFALGDIEADLLVAGHTHGGQVRLPFIGPLLTFSRVPRAWAAGATQLASGAMLVVSRGVGMERGLAPRLRFLCRPEIVMIDLVPVGDPESPEPESPEPESR